MTSTESTNTVKERRQIVPNGMLGMIVFTVTELMFFLAHPQASVFRGVRTTT